MILEFIRSSSLSLSKMILDAFDLGCERLNFIYVQKKNQVTLKPLIFFIFDTINYFVN